MKPLHWLSKKRVWCLGLLILLFAVSNRFYVTPILMYHHIDERDQEWKLSVSPENFRRQMEFLKAHNYNVLSLGEYVQKLKHGKKVPRKSVVITFDDGYENNITSAYPVLRELGFPATIYVKVDGVGEPDYLTAEDIRILVENDVQVGSHTLSHPSLQNIDLELAKKEIIESKRKLEKLSGRPVRHFSYPGGGWNPEVRALVEEAGYASATATHAGGHWHEDPFLLRRVRISRTADNLFVFWIKTSGFYTYLEDIRG